MRRRSLGFTSLIPCSYQSITCKDASQHAAKYRMPKSALFHDLNRLPQIQAVAVPHSRSSISITTYTPKLLPFPLQGASFPTTHVLSTQTTPLTRLPSSFQTRLSEPILLQKSTPHQAARSITPPLLQQVPIIPITSLVFRVWSLTLRTAYGFLIPDVLRRLKESMSLQHQGGPKLIGIDLRNDTIVQTILFPPTVAYSDSYLNDIRFDLRPSVTASGQGIGYITDSSQEGRNGLVMVDLGTGESWRHLDNTPEVRPERGFIPFIWGKAIYSLPPGPNQPITFAGNFGADGIALSADGETLCWTAVGSRTLYSIPTERLRDRSPFSEIQTQASVVSRGEKGVSDGLETDSNGLIYLGNFEDNAINVFNPANGTVSVFARDARIAWTDAFAIATDGYIYFTDNQLWRTKAHYPGTDRRVKPYVLFRAKLPGNRTKVNLQ